jgi:hypothetical protein
MNGRWLSAMMWLFQALKAVLNKNASGNGFTAMMLTMQYARLYQEQ